MSACKIFGTLIPSPISGPIARETRPLGWPESIDQGILNSLAKGVKYISGHNLEFCFFMYQVLNFR